MLPFIESMYCRKVGDILIYSKQGYDGDLTEMIEKWLRSDVLQGLLDGDIVFRSQAESYVAEVFLKEIEDLPKTEEVGEEWTDDELYWFGFLTTYWCFIDEITGVYIADNFDLFKIIESYDVFHTIDVEHAIDKIKEVCER